MDTFASMRPLEKQRVFLPVNNNPYAEEAGGSHWCGVCSHSGAIVICMQGGRGECVFCAWVCVVGKGLCVCVGGGGVGSLRLFVVVAVAVAAVADDSLASCVVTVALGRGWLRMPPAPVQELVGVR
jgi:hypothetical protein